MKKLYSEEIGKKIDSESLDPTKVILKNFYETKEKVHNQFDEETQLFDP